MSSDINIKKLSYQRIQALKQTGSASTYANEFRRHSLNLDWNDEPLRQHFFRGLKSEVKDKVLSPTDFVDLDSLIENAIKWDNLLYQRRKDPNNNLKSSDRSNVKPHSNFKPWNQTVHKPQQWQTPRPSTFGSGPAPMEVDSIRGPIMRAEKDRRRQKNLCLYCGNSGHQVVNCQQRPSSQFRKSISSIDRPSNQPAKEPPQ